MHWGTQADMKEDADWTFHGGKIGPHRGSGKEVGEGIAMRGKGGLLLGGGSQADLAAGAVAIGGIHRCEDLALMEASLPASQPLVV